MSQDLGRDSVLACFQERLGVGTGVLFASLKNYSIISEGKLCDVLIISLECVSKTLYFNISVGTGARGG